MRSMRRGRSEEVGDGTRPETMKRKEVLSMLDSNPVTEDMIRDMAGKRGTAYAASFSIGPAGTMVIMKMRITSASTGTARYT